MRIHSDFLTSNDIRNALQAEVSKGRIAPTVVFDQLSEHKSKSHRNAFEVRLVSWDKAEGDGRRRPNGGSNGAGNDYAATYDEWGWFMSALYEIDYLAVWGSVARPQYENGAHFDQRTAFTYNPELLINTIEDDCDPYPYVRKGAPRKGREGAIRIGTHERYDIFEPRTVESVKAFAKVA